MSNTDTGRIITAGEFSVISTIFPSRISAAAVSGRICLWLHRLLPVPLCRGNQPAGGCAGLPEGDPVPQTRLPAPLCQRRTPDTGRNLPFRVGAGRRRHAPASVYGSLRGFGKAGSARRGRRPDPAGEGRCRRGRMENGVPNTGRGRTDTGAGGQLSFHLPSVQALSPPFRYGQQPE